MKVEIMEGFSDIEVIIKCPHASEEIERMATLLRSLGEKLPGSKNGKTYLIDVRDVFYFETVDKRCFIYTEKDEYETLLKLYELEERFTQKGFIRSSKSQILNIAQIESLRPDFDSRIEAVLKNGEKLIISRQYSKLLKERLGLK